LAKLLGSTLPTADTESADPRAADLAYEAATRVAIGKTRDTRNYPLLFKENIAYGFSRNLYALRSWGILAAFIGIALALTSAWHASHAGMPQLIPWVCFALNAGALLVWLLHVDSDSVRIPAFSYAERLFEAIDAPAPARTPRKKS
jgi:hypothetical protein